MVSFSDDVPKLPKKINELVYCSGQYVGLLCKINLKREGRIIVQRMHF